VLIKQPPRHHIIRDPRTFNIDDVDRALIIPIRTIRQQEVRVVDAFLRRQGQELVDVLVGDGAIFRIGVDEHDSVLLGGEGGD